jgi:hypothetical protein
LKTGEFVDAERDLTRFLSDDGGASQEDLASARAALAQSRTHIGILRLRVTPNGARAHVDQQLIALVPGEFVEVRVETGAHKLLVEADNHENVEQNVQVQSAKPTSVDLALHEVGGPPVPPHKDPELETTTNSRRTMGYAFVAGAGVAAVAGIVFGLRALALESRYNDAPAGAQDPSARSQAKTLGVVTDISFLLAIAAGGVGTYFVLTSRPQGANTGVVLGPGFTGIAGSF